MDKLKYIIAISLLAFIGCKNGPEQVAKVDNCDEYSSNERDCNLASQKDDTKCYFSNNKCVAVPAPAGASGTCASLSSDQASCEMRFDCKFANNSCTATAADCTNVKNQTSCDNTYGAFCLWNTTASTCEKTTATAGAIYNWKKITLPAGTMNELTNFVVSKDNQHAYAYTTDAAGGGAKGLYHSADKGATWTRFGGAAAGDGTVRGKVAPTANDCDYDSTAGAPIDLKPTQHGAVLIDDNSTGVWILEGATVKWAIQNGVNDNGTATGAPTEVANFAAKDIKFIDVVDINGVETIAFAQKDDAATEYMLWLKPTTNLQYTALNHHPLRVEILTNAGANLTDTQQWMRAGNTYDGNLLLASVIGNQTNKGTGIWEITKANLPAADGTSPATIGQLADDNARLFPENGKAWAGNPTKSNLNIQVIGSFANGADHEYFAGINSGVLAHQKGGLAHYTGSQFGHSAGLDMFDGWSKMSVFSINNFNGKTRVVTNLGIFGVGIDGKANKAGDYHISAFASSKQDMMEGTSDAVPFNPSHNTLLVNIFGDDDLSWYWVDRKGTNPETGIYLREKGTGQLRP